MLWIWDIGQHCGSHVFLCESSLRTPGNKVCKITHYNMTFYCGVTGDVNLEWISLKLFAQYSSRALFLLCNHSKILWVFIGTFFFSSKDIMSIHLFSYFFGKGMTFLVKNYSFLVNKHHFCLVSESWRKISFLEPP